MDIVNTRRCLASVFALLILASPTVTAANEHAGEPNFNDWLRGDSR